MKESIFTELVTDDNWEKMNKAERVRMLQQIEHENSTFQKRAEREVIADGSYVRGKANDPNDRAFAIFDLENPTKIILDDSIISTGIKAVESIHHEGFHAMCHDFYNNVSDINAFVKINRERLIRERENLDIVYSYCRGNDMGPLIRACQYEEYVVKTETTLALLNKILTSCESPADCLEMLEPYEHILLTLLNRDKFFELMAEACKKFDAITNCANTIGRALNSHMIFHINTTKKISDNINPELTKTLDKSYALYKNLKDAPPEAMPALAPLFMFNFIESASRHK